MELKELARIFQRRRYMFFGTACLFVFGAWAWQQSQPTSYQATLLINIGRTGTSDTTNYYTYDSFYRLQADERFADTVVRWLSSPRVVEDIYGEAKLDPGAAGLKDPARVFAAGRLSSQMISVKYTGENRKALVELAPATIAVLNRYAGALNTETKEKNWFVVVGSEPVIRDGRIGLDLVLAVGLALGLFFGFWAVLLRHYLSRD